MSVPSVGKLEDNRPITDSNLFTPNTEKTFSAFTRAMNEKGIDNRDSTALFQKFNSARLSGKITHIPRSDNLPGAIVLPKTIFTLESPVGRGGFSEVHRSSAFVYGTPYMKSNLAIKVAQRPIGSFFKEKEALKAATGEQFEKELGINWPIAEGRTEDSKRPFCLDYLYDGDFATPALFCSTSEPADFLAPRFLQIVRGLALFHRNGYLHRDIKPHNMLFNQSISQKSGVLTDFGLLATEKFEIHHTSCTPGYDDPAMYLQESGVILLNQKERKGRQTKEGDCYALGRSFEEILRSVIEGNIDNLDIEKKLQKTKWKIIKSNLFSNQALIDLDRKYPLQCHYVNEKIVLGYNPIDVRFQAYKEIWDLYDEKRVFSQKQIEVLRELTELALLQLQDPTPSNRPTADQTREVLERLCHKLGIEFEAYGLKKPTYGDETEDSKSASACAIRGDETNGAYPPSHTEPENICGRDIEADHKPRKRSYHVLEEESGAGETVSSAAQTELSIIDNPASKKKGRCEKTS